MNSPTAALDHPQVILLDLNLPKIHGVEVLRRVKADSRTCSIPSRPDLDERRIRHRQLQTTGCGNFIAKRVDFQIQRHDTALKPSMGTVKPVVRSTAKPPESFLLPNIRRVRFGLPDLSDAVCHLFPSMFVWHFSCKRGGREKQISCSARPVCLAHRPKFYRRQERHFDLGPRVSPDATGYNVYYGMNSGIYPDKLSVGNVTTATISNLTAGVTYFFVATTVGINGNESVFSDEARFIVPGVMTMSQGANRGDSMLIKFPVAPGHWYESQATTDFQSWITIWQTAVATSNAWGHFTDPNASGPNSRLYRLSLH